MVENTKESFMVKMFSLMLCIISTILFSMEPDLKKARLIIRPQRQTARLNPVCDQELLQYASRKDWLMVRYSILDGANPNAVEDDGTTLLMRAATFDKSSLCELLLQKGALIHVQDQNGWSALHHAAFRVAGDTCRVLLEHGANIHLKDNQGETSFDVAQFWQELPEVAGTIEILTRAAEQSSQCKQSDWGDFFDIHLNLDPFDSELYDRLIEQLFSNNPNLFSNL